MAVFHTDIVIVGGGIAGLWTLATARKHGYNAVLLEKDQLGAGQSIASQGIIHGGSKYALGGKLTEATSTISRMPAIWQQALDGKHTVNLESVRVLSDNQFLLPSAGIDTQLLSFLGSKTMSSFTEAIKVGNLPDAYQAIGIKRKAFRLNEMILDTRSVFTALAGQLHDYIFQADVTDSMLRFDKQLDRFSLNLGSDTLYCRQPVLAGGAGNSGFADSPVMQRRPLHMVMAKGKQLPLIYAHFIGRSSKPLLTITSHPSDDATVWYMGGDLAENGTGLSKNRQIEQCKKLLNKLLPAFETIRHCDFDTFHIDRAEPRQKGLKRPDDAFVTTSNGVITGWPTKLALAPRFAEKVMASISFEAQASSSAAPALNLEKPAIADYPWSTL